MVELATAASHASGRLRIALASVAVHVCIGSIYASSVLVQPLQDSFGWSRPDVTLAFSIAIALLGLSAAASGTAIERRGARWASWWSMVFVALGYLGSGCALHLGSKYGFYFCYGVVGGIGLGLGYMAPLGVLMQAFPRHRGMATGLAVTGFGMGPMVFSPIMVWLFSSFGLVVGLFVLAWICACVIGASAWAFGRHRSDTGLPALALPIQASGKTFYFLSLWVMLCINISCGIALISVAAPLMQEISGASAQSAAALVGVAGLFNAAGRIFWANMSDVMGRPSIWISLFFLGLLSFSGMSVVSDVFLFQAFFMLAMACFGGGFACMPPYVADLFGPDRVPRVYGTMMTALSAAGFIGPSIIAQVRHHSGSYMASLPIFSCLLTFACILSIFVSQRLRHRPLAPRLPASV